MRPTYKNIKSILLINDLNDDFADDFKLRLERLFKATVEICDAEFSDVEKDKFDLLVVYTEPISIYTHKRKERNLPPPIYIAKTWLEKVSNKAVAVIVTRGVVDEYLLKHVEERILVVEQSTFLDRSIYDYLNAAHSNYSLFPPTEIKLICKKSSDGTSANIDIEIPEAPLSHLLTEVAGITKEESAAITLPETPLQISHTDDINGQVYHQSRAIYNSTSPADFFHTFIESIKSSIKDFWDGGEQTESVRIGPIPIHIRIHIDPEMLSLPLDLALRIYIDLEQLCALFPVTWVLSGSRQKICRDESTKDPFQDFAHHVLYSCEEEVRDFPAIKGVKEHADSIAKYVKKDRGKFVGSKEELREILIEKYDSTKNKCAYVVSHGEHPNAEQAGVILTDHRSNSAGTQGVNDKATAVFLQPKKDEKGPNFVYFNCCSLGHHSPPENTTHTAFGGFAQGIISNGFTKELICNRWPVDIEQAFKLAEHFFELRPLSSYARAAALHRARRLVQDAHNENPTWLAPIHILAERRGGY